MGKVVFEFANHTNNELMQGIKFKFEKILLQIIIIFHLFI
jgi:hypothetical protein